METLLQPTLALLDPFSGVSDAPTSQAQSEEGKKVSEAAWEARRLWRGQAVLRLSAPPTGAALAGLILGEALERYRRPDGYEGHLVEAAWRLEQMGQKAWPVLRDLLLAGPPECEYFLGAAVRLEGVAPQYRLPPLLAAARNPDANVRSRLLELLDEMPGAQRREVLGELLAAGRDDSITDRRGRFGKKGKLEGCSVNGRYLVRRFSGSVENWFKDDPNVEDLAKKVFDLADAEQSVYEVADGKEECLAVAAHKLTDPKISPDDVSVLRIERGHLPRFGIRVDEEQFGTTGVPRLDRRHRNLVANREQLIQLVRFLAERCYRGHDQVRRIKKSLVVRSLNTICGYPPSHCPNHAKLIAGWCQSSPKGAPPNPSLDQIEREVRAVEFEDEAIRPGAERLSSGDPVGDWYKSLNELRRSYAEHYLPAVAQRIAQRFGHR